MRNEQQGKLRAEIPETAGYRPATRPTCLASAGGCGSGRTFMASGGSGPDARVFQCHDCGRRFKAGVSD